MINNEKQLKDKYINEALQMIATASSEILDVSIQDLMSTKRQREIVDARRITYAVARLEYNFTLSAIARYFDKNHATILHQVNTHQGWCETEPQYQDKYEQVKCFLFDEDNLEKMVEFIRTKNELNKQIEKSRCKESE